MNTRTRDFRKNQPRAPFIDICKLALSKKGFILIKVDLFQRRSLCVSFKVRAFSDGSHFEGKTLGTRLDLFLRYLDFTHKEGFRNRYCRKSTTFLRGAPNGDLLDKSFGIDSLKLFLVTFFFIQLSEWPRAKSSMGRTLGASPYRIHLTASSDWISCSSS